MKYHSVVALTALALAGLAPGDVSGQRARAWTRLETYSFERVEAQPVDQVQLLTIPFEAAWELPWIGMDVRGAYARGIATLHDGGYSEIAGPTDSRITVTARIRSMAVSGFAALPTGDAGYSQDQLLLLGIVSSDLMPWEVRSWGAGGGFGASARLAGWLGPVAVGLSGGYVSALEYEPLEGATSLYRPGSQVRLAAGARVRVWTASELSLALGHQRFADDVVDGVNLFRSGTRSEVFASLAHALGARESGLLYAGYYTRTTGTLLPVNAYVAGTVLPGVVESPPRRLVVAGFELQATRRRLTVVPALSMRLLQTDDDVGSGWLGSAGLGLDYRLLGGGFGRRLIVTPEAAVMVGSFRNRSGVDAGMQGWSAGVAMRWEPGR